MEESVQWAVLNSESTGIEISESDGASELLEEFVRAYSLALVAHSKRLELEELGHPDVQASVSPPFPLSSCQLSEVERVLSTLEDTLDSWKRDVRDYCSVSPRLCLLSQKSRVHFLLAFRGNPSVEAIEDSLLPYVIQCFPDLLNSRETLLSALSNVLTISLADLYQSESYLRMASELLSSIETELNSYEDSDTPSDISYRELFGSTEVQVYTEFVQDTVSVCGHLGTPSMVLWGNEKTSPTAVQEWLLVAQTGLCSTMHVLHVNEMLPRTRDLLLRGLQTTEIKCSVCLFFSTREGLDAFTHFPSNSSPCRPLQETTQKSLFAHGDFFGVESSTQDEDEVVRSRMLIDTWIVAGRSGDDATRFYC
jgi:hypothetical protein